MHSPILIAAVAALATAVPARADQPADPYAGQQTRAIKALSEEDVSALRNGEGMGLAKAAELNGYPGPAHVIELAKELRLTPDQLRKVTAIRDQMSATAKPLGSEIIDREQELDRLFAQGSITAESLTADTVVISELQGRLRSVHLTAHLETRSVLTPEQLAEYQQLRGYGNRAAASNHPEGDRRHHSGSGTAHDH